MTDPSYGAQTLDLTPPNGAILARLPGDGAAEAQRILDVAMRDVPPGGTIVVHEGDWPVSIAPPRQKPFTIQAAPGPRPRLVGYLTSPAEAWTAEDGMWWIPWTPMDSTPNSPGIIGDNPLAAVPEQVWINGVPAKLSGPLERGEFAVGPDRLWIADDPADHEIRVAVRQTAFRSSQDGNPRVDLIGLDVVGYATPSLLRAAVTAFADDTLVSHVRVVECSAAGISARGRNIRFDHLEALGNGQLGIHGWQAHGLDIGYSIISANNRDDYSRIGEAGGAKWSGSLDVTAHDNLLVDNNGHGLWADLRSDRARYLRNDIVGGAAAGIHFEGSADGAAYGNRATGCVVGILGSNCGGFDVAHNTVTGNSDDIRFQRSDQSDEFPFGGNTVRGNARHLFELPAYPSVVEIAALGLTPEQANEPHTGWYGPTPTPEEPPMTEPYDFGPFDEARTRFEAAGQALWIGHDQLVAEIRRLEGLIATDDTFARIADLEEDLNDTALHLWNTAVQVNTLTDTIVTLNATVYLLGEQRDTAIVRAEEAEELYGEARAHIATLDQQRADDRLTIADLTQQLADCEGAEPEPDPIVVGGSHKQGWPALKTMTAPAMPGGFRLYANTTRLTGAQLGAISAVLADGAIPYVSVTRTDEEGDDAFYNAGKLFEVGTHTAVGAIIPAHEPTQKMTGPEFVAMVTAALPVYRDLLPNWERLLCFMRHDFLDRTLDRHPANYLAGFDWTLATGLAIDVYDKGDADQWGNGKTFGELMAQVEGFAREHGLPIHVTEAGAPDTGQYGRRAMWKPWWYQDAYEHMLGSDVDYRSFLTFNSDVGPDSPPAVGDVKAGWYADTTPEALAAYVRCIERSRA